MKHVFHIFTLFLLLTTGTTAAAEDYVAIKAKADSAFTQEKFDQAAQLYQQIATEATSLEVSYNLGCCYYRMDSMAKSVLWFERAYRLSPGDEDVRFNLEMAQSNTVDKIIPRHEFILVTVWRRVVNSMSLQAWAVTSIVSFVFTLLLFALYFFSDRIALRKVGFFAAIIGLLLTIMGNVCALQQRSHNRQRTSGVVMQSAVTVKSTPAESGSDLFVIHEGTCVEVLDSGLKEWCEIKIADGKVGWIPKASFELI